MAGIIKRVKDVFKTINSRRNRPLHIEFNLTDFCNLNCKGCSHYSPLAPAEFEPLHSLENSMKSVSRANNINLLSEIYLIGGETLLYPDLKDAMTIARKYFPTIPISIFTNGLLIPKMDREFWDLCKKLKIKLAVTRYPIRFDYMKVENICREMGVEVETFGDRGLENSFFKLPLDPSKKQNKILSHFRCCSFGCVTVDNGKIFPCSQSACIRHFNNKFGSDFHWEKGDFIEIDKLTDIKDIKRLRDRPVPFCSYCKHQTFTEYAPSQRVAEEWT